MQRVQVFDSSGGSLSRCEVQVPQTAADRLTVGHLKTALREAAGLADDMVFLSPTGQKTADPGAVVKAVQLNGVLTVFVSREIGT
jgi:hypothetical protein